MTAFFLVPKDAHHASGDSADFGHVADDEHILVSRDAYEEMRERAERAEARLSSITGMAREDLVREACRRQREACAMFAFVEMSMQFDESDAADLRDSIRETPLATQAWT